MTDLPEELAKIADSGVVAVMRDTDPDTAVEVARALVAGGVTTLELTADADGVTDSIAAVTDALGDEATVGAGTVLEDATADAVIDAGAEFVVSPTVELAVVEVCNHREVPVAPGALTPTEVRTAWAAGADFVKIFPAASVGPKHLSRIHGPLPDIPLMPTGGVGTENAAAFIEQGAIAVGAGSALTDQDAIDASDWDAITSNARELVETVQEARKG